MIHDVPPITAESERYWQEAANGRLCLPHCGNCRRWEWFPRERCLRCGEPTTWSPLSGDAELVSYTVEHRGPRRHWKDQAPYVIGLVRLREGVTMLTTVVGCDADELTCGMSLVVAFGATTDPDIVVPVFTPKREAAS